MGSLVAVVPSGLRPIDIYIASPAYTSDIRCSQFWRRRRVEGSLSFKHYHVIDADFYRH